MVKLLQQNQVDTEAEAVDAVMTAAEEAAAAKQFARNDSGAPDLSDGGNVNGARLTPMSGGQRMTEGRAAARRVWMWNGTESVVPLAWAPDGKSHDGARRYLRKKHCLCCGHGGFTPAAGRVAACPNCVKNHCTRCNGSTDPKKIIPNFYLRQEDVPFPTNFYGHIPCFLPICIRRDERGFKTEEEMRMHARSRHRMEYQAHVETLNASRGDEVAALRARLDTLTGQAMAAASAPAPKPPRPMYRGRETSEAAKARMAHARAAKAAKQESKETAPAAS